MKKQFDHSSVSATIAALELGSLNRQLADHWLSLWQNGQPPSRSAIHPSKLEKFLPGTAILDIHPDDSIRIRIAGVSFRAAFGFDPSRYDLIALTIPEQRATRLARCKEIVAGSVASAIRHIRSPGEADIVTSDVYLPLGGVNEDGARSWLFHTSWRPGNSGWRSPLPIQTLGLAAEFVTRALR